MEMRNEEMDRVSQGGEWRDKGCYGAPPHTALCVVLLSPFPLTFFWSPFFCSRFSSPSLSFSLFLSLFPSVNSAFYALFYASACFLFSFSLPSFSK